MRHRHSDYMLWAKTQGRARFNLATSGVGSFPQHELPVTIDQLEINGDSTYGYAPLQHAISKKCGVDPDCVVAAAGTSMANHLAMATLIDPGDEVLIEQPTYELLTSMLLYLGATVRHFARTEESGYALDPAQVRRAITRNLIAWVHRAKGNLLSLHVKSPGFGGKSFFPRQSNRRSGPFEYNRA